ncbi:conserved hypothetical protein [Theileria equi strain WA]|uniref:Uncharacterized protein n=1 Tax=Theileria equi strain WA TaxID=1537102 RepID=L1LF10_THEEQ|nr:conserved hypothetical protein [Theileria equi strain WA]EKX73869.1 conserved hypothetical protein [Theileria equi strain WA]|eukprot:XP_004833321.1 conserved hypothetical protein [Theileria equi strain WA]
MSLTFSMFVYLYISAACMFMQTHFIFQTPEVENQRATSTYEIDTEKSMDSRSILERNVEIGKKLLSGELEANVYRGKGAYKPIMNIREGSIAASKYTGLYGPVRASGTNIRTTLRIDYQPDVCKDYKETGYCGFGDTCKFLHDRSDYKSGWQLEKEWEQQQAEKRLKMQAKLDKWQRKMQASLNGESVDSCSESESEESESDSDCSSSSESEDDETMDKSLKKLIKSKAKKMEIPFCCLSCKRVWRLEMDPIVTSCNHYFCQQCAIASYSKNSKCAKCGNTQDGILNKATNVLKLLESIGKGAESAALP